MVTQEDEAILSRKWGKVPLYSKVKNNSHDILQYSGVKLKHDIMTS